MKPPVESLNPESRSSVRKEIKVGVIYWLDKKGERFRIDGASLTLNLSGTGILIRMFHPVDIGTEIFMKFMLGKSVIQCTGIVARIEQVPGARAWNTGVKLHLKPEDQDVLLEYIQKP